MGVGSDSAVRKGHPILFGSIVLFSIIQLCLTAWLTARYNDRHDYPFPAVQTRIRYILFCSVWTAIAGTGFLVMFWVMAGSSIMTSVAAHFILCPICHLDFLGRRSASITQTLGGGLSCSQQDIWPYCGQLNAVEGFSWLIWILVTFTLVMVIIRGIAASRAGSGYGSSLVAGDA
ncbi:hypothetical protein BKA70DRAFT_1269088 [Coprinopsis sp. MPI-PUGE-AT-0042]|nr:hypothetical protein BKA70DRAFT_1269088 [Coprinopsis sp. MPI-PUGE-AT-0042]